MLRMDEGPPLAVCFSLRGWLFSRAQSSDFPPQTPLHTWAGSLFSRALNQIQLLKNGKCKLKPQQGTSTCSLEKLRLRTTPSAGEDVEGPGEKGAGALGDTRQAPEGHTHSPGTWPCHSQMSPRTPTRCSQRPAPAGSTGNHPNVHTAESEGSTRGLTGQMTFLQHF